MSNTFVKEKDHHANEIADMTADFDIGPPPPIDELMDSISPAPVPVDSVILPKPDIVLPPPPPPPDYQARSEAPVVAPEQQIPVPNTENHTVDAQPIGVAASNTSTAGQAQTSPVTALPKSEVRKEIEELLSEGLTDIYKTMTPQEQELFRKKGEETATAIEQMLGGFRATARKVVDLIRAWLRTIPGVNKFFLEQESKLKTDEILKLQRKLKKQDRLNKLNIQ